MDQKKYGLIRLSKTDKPKTALKKNIFESDSDEESQNDTKKVGTSSGVKRQTQLDISRALNEDPNVFEYDSIYDDMKTKKETNIAIDSTNKEKPKPKYINNLLKFAENRNKEMERRIERKIQKERESEGNQFEDKEQFVTNAYKEKLNEMKAADEKDRREAAIEELLDVRKQKDLSGFYRHLFNDDMSSQKKELDSETVVPPKDNSEEIPKIIPKPKTNRQFRRRRSSSEESSGSPQRVRNDIKVENKQKSNETIEKEDEDSLESDSEDNHSNDEKSSIALNLKQEINSDLKDNKEVENKETTKEESIKIPKLDKRELLLKIFTKRTVGEAYTDAQMRYFQRKDNYVI